MGWSDYRPTGLTHRDARSAGGYTLVAPIGGNWVYLLDADGRIVHGWNPPNFQPGYGYLLPGGRLLVRGQPLVDTEVGPGQPAGTADILLELDWEGKTLWHWSHSSFHHDMCRLENGNTLVITWDKCDPEIGRRVPGGYSPEQTARLKADPEHVKFFMGGLGVGGRPRDLTGYLADTILEIAPSGEIVSKWHTWEHLDPGTDVMCPLEFPFEWSHCNSVEYLPGGKVLLSFREISRLMMISWPKGDVLWKWGRDVISHQHDATLTPQGNILVFDNGTHHPVTPHSRIVEVNPRTNQIVWQYLPKVVFGFFSGHIGGCDRLTNGNTIICEGQSGRVFEVTPSCEVCWEWINPFILPFKGVLASMLFRAHRYAADSPELRGMPIKPERWAKLNAEMGLDQAARRGAK